MTGNLQSSAEVKLRCLGLDIGGYASDDAHRPALVGVAQKRPQAAYGHSFTKANTVIIGDSTEDVRTGPEGGAQVIDAASGTTSGLHTSRRRSRLRTTRPHGRRTLAAADQEP